MKTVWKRGNYEVRYYQEFGGYLFWDCSQARGRPLSAKTIAKLGNYKGSLCYKQRKRDGKTIAYKHKTNAGRVEARLKKQTAAKRAGEKVERQKLAEYKKRQRERIKAGESVQRSARPPKKGEDGAAVDDGRPSSLEERFRKERTPQGREELRQESLPPGWDKKIFSYYKGPKSKMEYTREQGKLAEVWDSAQELIQQYRDKKEVLDTAVLQKDLRKKYYLTEDNYNRFMRRIAPTVRFEHSRELYKPGDFMLGGMNYKYITDLWGGKAAPAPKDLGKSFALGEPSRQPLLQNDREKILGSLIKEKLKHETVLDIPDLRVSAMEETGMTEREFDDFLRGNIRSLRMEGPRDASSPGGIKAGGHDYYYITGEFSRKRK